VIEIRSRESLLIVQLAGFRIENEQAGEAPAAPIAGQGLAPPRTGSNMEITLDELTFELSPLARDQRSPTTDPVQLPDDRVVVFLGIGVHRVEGADQFQHVGGRHGRLLETG